MNDRLTQELNRVAHRYRRVVVMFAAAMLWLTFALMAAALLAANRGLVTRDSLWFMLLAPLILPLATVPLILARLKTIRDPLWLARRIEHRFPELDTRLLASIQPPTDAAQENSFLRQVVIDQAADHAQKTGWEKVVPSNRLALATVAQLAMLLLFVAILVGLACDLRPGGRGMTALSPPVSIDDAVELKIDPEDTSLERNTALLVRARFNTPRLPAEVELLYKDADGKPQKLPMTKALDDPLFAGRVAAIKNDTEFAVRYGTSQSRWFKVTVFDYPALKQADANLKFPDYTALPEKNIEDTRTITAVEGTKATITFHLNKAVAKAQLVPAMRPAGTMPATQPAPQPVTLTVNPADPTVYSMSVDLKQSQAYKLQLVDADGRTNKTPADLTLHVIPNKPPELKVAFPGHDIDVSPIEELTVRGTVHDDFGVKRVGITYALAGEDPIDVTLGENIKANDRRDLSSLIPFEKLHAQPDQLLSYYLWAEDTGPDGKSRRTASDMFFAEVRPFEQIFRQGQQPAGGEEEQQQQREQQQNGRQQQGGQAQRAEQLAEQQKQIIAATWKVIRRETSQSLTSQFVPDVRLLQDSQAAAKEQASGVAEAAEDDRSKAQMADVIKQMDRAIQQLATAQDPATAKPLPAVLAAEQAAYQNLLKMRARDSQVVRANRQQGQQSQSSAAQRRQQQLNQLDLDNEQNRYETQRQASAQRPQPPQETQAAETRQVLSRLRELAQRQEDLNRQMQDLQSSLQRARDQAQRDELERQLARLRDQQQQMLRDTDELQNRLDQPENQERLADANQQLQQTRENIQQASQQLQQGQVPQAAAAGQRASEQLNNLRDQVRRDAAGQFSEDMTRMREDARALDQNQQALSRQMTALDQAAATQPAGLRDGDAQQQRAQQREQVAQGLEQQRKDLDKLLDNMRTTVEQAETPEPLLSRQLYDTIRQTRQAQTPEALDTTRQLVQQGLVPQARQTGADADRGIARVRQGVEQAAQSVLGDDSEALRRARNQLDELAGQLTREIQRNNPAAGTQPTTQRALAGGRADTQPATQPNANRQQIARNNSTTQPNAQTRNGQPNGPQQTTQVQNPGDSPERQLASAGQNQNQPDAKRAPQQGQQRGQQEDSQQQSGAPQGDRQLAGQSRPQEGQGQQPGQQPRRGQQAGRGEQAQEGQQGQQAARGRQGGRGQQGQPQEGSPQDGQGQQAGRGQQGQQQEGQLSQQTPRGQQGQPQEGQQGQQTGRGQGRQGQPPEGQQAQIGRGQQDQQTGRGQQAGRGQGGRGQGAQPREAQPDQQPQEADAQSQDGQPGQQPGRGQGGPGRGTQANRGGRGQPNGNQLPQDQQAQTTPQDQQNAQGQPQDPLQNNPQPSGGGGQGGPIARGGTNGGIPRQINQTAVTDPRLAQNSSSATRPQNPATQPITQAATALPPGGLFEPDTGMDDHRDFKNPTPNDSQSLAGNGVITGDGFREWSDRMRDVEEMVGDPQLRAQAARIRERLAAARADFTKHAQDPNWAMVQQNIGRPLFELRQAISEELLRRQSAEARVPIDKEPVPPQYADEVRRYYERLGSGK